MNFQFPISFSPSASSKSNSEELSKLLARLQKEFLENRVKLDELDDPLCIYDNYTQQLQNILSSQIGSSATNPIIKNINAALLPLLDEATRTFVQDPRYRNDPRYLRLWLAYAKHCREAEEIFTFLGQNGIAQELATFYEEYAEVLEKQASSPSSSKDVLVKVDCVFKSGIERKAQPLERLKRKYAEFETRLRGSGIVIPAAKALNPAQSKAIEIRGYDAGLIHGGDLCFEEIRAQCWYSKPKIAKPTLSDRCKLPSMSPSRSNQRPFLPSIQDVENISEDEEHQSGLGVSVNPDDLTHINVFKDNTADLREIAKLVKAKSFTTATATAAAASADSNRLAPEDLLLNDILISMSPLNRKKAHLDENSPHQQPQLASAKEPDISGLLDPFDLDFRIAQCEAVLSQIASAIPNLNLRLDEAASGKIRAFEKSLGRDGSGPNHTVSSLRIASGHYFMEKKLGEGGYGKVYLAVDLLADSLDSEASEDMKPTEDSSAVNQVAIKIESPASVWESYILFRIHSYLEAAPPNTDASTRHFPKLLSASIYSDVSFLVIDYFEQGSLLGALNVYRQQNLSVEEAITLFYAAELVRIVTSIHAAGVLHTDIKLENLLIASGRSSGTSSSSTANSPWSSVFRRDGQEGWSERGLVLIDFGRAVDLKLLKEEEQTRFLIKSKHYAFNGAPKITEGRPVGHEMDWFGVADCLHWLLFQRPLQPIKVNSRYKLSSPLKRYWQLDTWEPLFDDLLNPPESFSSCQDRMRQHSLALGNKLEGWKKTPSLKSLLTRQEIMLYEHLPKRN